MPTRDSRADQRPPSWRVRVAGSLAIGAIAFALDNILDQNGASVLTAVVAGTTVAYCWFTYDLVRAAIEERNARAKSELAANQRLMERFIVELKQNLHRKGQTHAWHAHVPLEMSAFNEARHLFVGMPPDVWTHVAEISSRSARYNTLAEYSNARVSAGSGMADKPVRDLAAEVHNSQENAIPVIERWIAKAF